MPQTAPILLVDDDPAWLDLMELHLERRGLPTDKAASSAEAAELLAHHRFRAVVCDLEMPGEDGWAFRRNLRRTDHGRNLPFVFVSARTTGPGTSLPRPFISKNQPLEEIAETIFNIFETPEVAPSPNWRSRFRSRLRDWTWGVQRRMFPITKRGLDVFASGLALIFLGPLAILIALFIKLDSSGRVLFVQNRVGRDGRIFRILKFRSMHTDAEQRLAALAAQNDHGDSITFKMKEDPRITRVGRLLRRASLDELPQLWNVFVGDMHLVGPRPPTPVEVEEYGFEAWLRLGVTPGLTGLWQVSGRAELAFPEQLALDREYIQNSSFLNDLKILVATVPAVVGGRGAY